MRLWMMLAGVAVVTAGCSGGERERDRERDRDRRERSERQQDGGSGNTASVNAMEKARQMGLNTNQQAAVAACLTPEEQRQSPDSMSLEERQEKIGCLNEQAAQQMRAALPARVDAVTQLVSVEAEGPVLNYVYEVAVDASSIGEAQRQGIEAQVRQTACSTPEMRQTIGYGGAYHYEWRDRSGDTLHEVMIDGC